MGEAENSAAAKSADDQKKSGEGLREILDTPIGQDEAQKALAEIGVQVAQLTALRLRKTMEVNNIDQQLAAAEFEKSVIYRRCMNPAKDGAGAEAKAGEAK